MGQKVNPIGLRGKIVEDDKIRKYLNAKFSKAGISKIYIERTLKLVTVTISAGRPGVIIGKGGAEVDSVKEELKVITGKEIQINIMEVKRPDLDAQLVAQNIARQIEGRVTYKKAVKTAIAATMRAQAEGIKVTVAGRLGGAEIARAEHFKDGRIPLHTLRADIDYAPVEAHTTYGCIGVKVWICRGIVYGKRDLFANEAAKDQRPAGGGKKMFRGPRRDRDGRDRNRNNNRNHNN